MRKPAFLYAKTKATISCAITVQLISAFTFAIKIHVGVLSALQKSEISYLLSTTSVAVGLCQNSSETQETAAHFNLEM